MDELRPTGRSATSPCPTRRDDLIDRRAGAVDADWALCRRPDLEAAAHDAVAARGCGGVQTIIGVGLDDEHLPDDAAVTRSFEKILVAYALDESPEGW